MEGGFKDAAVTCFAQQENFESGLISANLHGTVMHCTVCFVDRQETSAGERYAW